MTKLLLSPRNKLYINSTNNKSLLAPQVLPFGSFIVVSTNKKLATLTCGDQSYTLQGDELEHIFRVDAFGDYICTATYTDLTDSSTVTVSETTIYFTKIPLSKIPSGYKEVQYIMTSGTQYINTNKRITNNSKITLDASVVIESGKAMLLGDLTDNSKACSLQPGSSGNRSRFGAGSYLGYVYSSATNFCKYEIDFRGVIANQGEYSYDWTGTVGEFTTVYPIFLFGSNNDGTPGYKIANGTRIKSFKIEEDGVLVQDFVPCIRENDSRVGMYDTVSETFFGNVEADNFIAGPNV